MEYTYKYIYRFQGRVLEPEVTTFILISIQYTGEMLSDHTIPVDYTFHNPRDTVPSQLHVPRGSNRILKINDTLLHQRRKEISNKIDTTKYKKPLPIPGHTGTEKFSHLWDKNRIPTETVPLQ